MVSPAGIEPATLCLEGRCSIQLSYGLLNLIVAALDLEKKIESATRAHVAQPPSTVRIPPYCGFERSNKTNPTNPCCTSVSAIDHCWRACASVSPKPATYRVK